MPQAEIRANFSTCIFAKNQFIKKERSTKQWLTIDIVYLRKDDITNGTVEWQIYKISLFTSYLERCIPYRIIFWCRCPLQCLVQERTERIRKKRNLIPLIELLWNFSQVIISHRKLWKMHFSKCCIFWVDTIFHIPSLDTP